MAIATAAAAGAAVFSSPIFLLVPVALLPIVATFAYPNGIWPFVPLTAIVISPSIFLVNGEAFEYDEAVQKAILMIAGLCFAVALGVRWSWIGAAVLAVVGLAALGSILNVGGRVEVTSGVLVRAAVGYCVPWLFLFINWRRLRLQRGLEYLAMLPLGCLIAGVVVQLAGVKGPAYRAPMPGIYLLDEGIPRLQGALIPPHLAELAVVALVSALCLAASPNTLGGFRIHVWIALDFVILMATVTRSEIAVGIVLILTYIGLMLGRNRLRTRQGRRAIWSIAAVAVVVCALAAPAIIKRTTGDSYEHTFNTSGRQYAWDFFQGFVADNPLTGKGLGFCSIAVKLYMSDYVDQRFIETFRTPHNEYLRWLVDGGLFFALGLLLVILAAFVMAARAQHGGVRVLIVVFALGTLALSYVDNTFSTVQFSVPFVILLGLLAAHPSGEKKPTGRHRVDAVRGGEHDSILEASSEPVPRSGAPTHPAVTVGPAPSE